jgi:polyhydroxybutyrate depolymerase
MNGLPAGTHTVEVKSGALSRSFDIHVPEHAADNDFRPVVFFWHGFGGSPAKIVDFAQPNAIADKKRYFAVYPKGTGLIAGFNGAGCCPGVFADDVAFFRNIVTWLTSNMCADAANIFSAGFSNGGFMSNKLACEAYDIVKAIAVHSGSMGKSYTATPDHGVPVLLIHGDADPTVPYFGNGNWMSFAELSIKWADINQCGTEQNARAGYTSQNSECVRFDKCARNDVPLEFCTIKGLAHAWSGNGDFQLDATAHIFDFFEALTED